MSQFKIGKNTRKRLDRLEAVGKKSSIALVRAIEDFINYTPIDFGIIHNGTIRTAEEQNELFIQDRSKCDGYNKKSKHQLGLAVDLVPFVEGAYTWGLREAFYLSGSFMLYCRMKGLDVTSGSDWNKDGILKDDSWDPCHFQIKEI